jgi:hypothetical protein
MLMLSLSVDSNNVTNLHAAMDFARTYLYNTQSWAQELNKPILLEEFGEHRLPIYTRQDYLLTEAVTGTIGMARDNWQNIEAGRYIYHENATTTNKDTYFEMIMSTIVQCESQRRFQTPHLYPLTTVLVFFGRLHSRPRILWNYALGR